MEGISVTCPNCSAVLNVEKELEFCFCTYCGTKVFIPKMGGSGDSNINITVNNGSAENFILRARQFENEEDYDNAEIYYNRALDIDASNIEAQEGLKRVKNVIHDDNIVVNRGGKWGDAPLTVIIDGEKVGKITHNSNVTFAIPVGKHTIQFYWSPLCKSKIIEINIKNNKTVYQLDIGDAMFGVPVKVIELKRGQL